MYQKLEPKLNPEHGIAVFTDGSCWTKDRGGGWAWVALDAFDGINYECGYYSDTTISQMELEAVGQAIHCVSYDLEEEGYNTQEIDLLVYSDSEYVVLGWNDKSRKRNKNQEWWYSAEMYRGNWRSVTLEHCKGHVGNEFNELADKLAGEARKNKNEFDEYQEYEKGHHS